MSMTSSSFSSEVVPTRDAAGLITKVTRAVLAVIFLVVQGLIWPSAVFPRPRSPSSPARPVQYVLNMLGRNT
jgi:hypothetical protein